MNDECPAAILADKDASKAELADADEDRQAASHEKEVDVGPDVGVCEGPGVGLGVGVGVGMDVLVDEDEMTEVLELDVETMVVEFDEKVAGSVNGN